MAFTDPNKSTVERLRELKELASGGFLSQEEIETEKKAILNQSSTVQEPDNSEPTLNPKATGNIALSLKSRFCQLPKWGWIVIAALLLGVVYLIAKPSYTPTWQTEDLMHGCLSRDGRPFEIWPEKDGLEFILVGKQKAYFLPATYEPEKGRIKIGKAEVRRDAGIYEGPALEELSDFTLELVRHGDIYDVKSSTANTLIDGDYTYYSHKDPYGSAVIIP